MNNCPNLQNNISKYLDILVEVNGQIKYCAIKPKFAEATGATTLQELEIAIIRAAANTEQFVKEFCEGQAFPDGFSEQTLMADTYSCTNVTWDKVTNRISYTDALGQSWTVQFKSGDPTPEDDTGLYTIEELYDKNLFAGKLGEKEIGYLLDKDIIYEAMSCDGEAKYYALCDGLPNGVKNFTLYDYYFTMNFSQCTIATYCNDSLYKGHCTTAGDYGEKRLGWIGYKQDEVVKDTPLPGYNTITLVKEDDKKEKITFVQRADGEKFGASDNIVVVENNQNTISACQGDGYKYKLGNDILERYFIQLTDNENISSNYTYYILNPYAENINDVQIENVENLLATLNIDIESTIKNCIEEFIKGDKTINDLENTLKNKPLTCTINQFEKEPGPDGYIVIEFTDTTYTNWQFRFKVQSDNEAKEELITQKTDDFVLENNREKLINAYSIYEDAELIERIKAGDLAALIVFKDRYNTSVRASEDGKSYILEYNQGEVRAQRFIFGDDGLPQSNPNYAQLEYNEIELSPYALRLLQKAGYSDFEPIEMSTLIQNYEGNVDKKIIPDVIFTKDQLIGKGFTEEQIEHLFNTKCSMLYTYEGENQDLGYYDVEDTNFPSVFEGKNIDDILEQLDNLSRNVDINSVLDQFINSGVQDDNITNLGMRLVLLGCDDFEYEYINDNKAMKISFTDSEGKEYNMTVGCDPNNIGCVDSNNITYYSQVDAFGANGQYPNIRQDVLEKYFDKAVTSTDAEGNETVLYYTIGENWPSGIEKTAKALNEYLGNINDFMKLFTQGNINSYPDILAELEKLDLTEWAKSADKVKDNQFFVNVGSKTTAVMFTDKLGRTYRLECSSSASVYDKKDQRSETVYTLDEIKSAMKENGIEEKYIDRYLNNYFETVGWSDYKNGSNKGTGCIFKFKADYTGSNLNELFTQSAASGSGTAAADKTGNTTGSGQGASVEWDLATFAENFVQGNFDSFSEANKYLASLGMTWANDINKVNNNQFFINIVSGGKTTIVINKDGIKYEMVCPSSKSFHDKNSVNYVKTFSAESLKGLESDKISKYFDVVYKENGEPKFYAPKAQYETLFADCDNVDDINKAINGADFINDEKDYEEYATLSLDDLKLYAEKGSVNALKALKENHNARIQQNINGGYMVVYSIGAIQENHLDKTFTVEEESLLNEAGFEFKTIKETKIENAIDQATQSCNNNLEQVIKALNSIKDYKVKVIDYTYENNQYVVKYTVDGGEERVFNIAQSEENDIFYIEKEAKDFFEAVKSALNDSEKAEAKQYIYQLTHLNNTNIVYVNDINYILDNLKICCSSNDIEITYQVSTPDSKGKRKLYILVNGDSQLSIPITGEQYDIINTPSSDKKNSDVTTDEKHQDNNSAQNITEDIIDNNLIDLQKLENEEQESNPQSGTTGQSPTEHTITAQPSEDNKLQSRNELKP